MYYNHTAASCTMTIDTFQFKWSWFVFWKDSTIINIIRGVYWIGEGQTFKIYLVMRHNRIRKNSTLRVTIFISVKLSKVVKDEESCVRGAELGGGGNIITVNLKC